MNKETRKPQPHTAELKPGECREYHIGRGGELRECVVRPVRDVIARWSNAHPWFVVPRTDHRHRYVAMFMPWGFVLIDWDNEGAIVNTNRMADPANNGV